MTTQMGILIGAAFVLMFVALFFLFASVRYRFLPLLFVMLGLTYSFGFLGATRIPIEYRCDWCVSRPSRAGN